jgi:small-conductance mechanosensitive channel/CRP-like cAMP-binding protein
VGLILSGRPAAHKPWAMAKIMSLSDSHNYIWFLTPLLAYLALASILEFVMRRFKILSKLRLPLHMIILGLGLELALFRAPLDVTQLLAPYARALMAFGAIVLIIQALEGLSIGYFMVRLRGLHVPPILRRFILIVAYFLVATIILRTYLNLDVTSLVATSAVMSFVVGLASQDLLGSILAGIVIGVERPIVLGDWVTIEGQEGRVVNISWRRTTIETRNNDVIIMPNSQIMKSAFTNHTTPDPLHRVTLRVGVHYRHAPNQVKQTMVTAARLCPHVLESPVPNVFLEEFGDSAITYRINMWIDDLALLERVREQVNTLIWYQFKRGGIEIPFPIRTLHRPSREVPAEMATQEMAARLLPLLSESELFASIPGEALENLARSMRLETYGGGEVLFHENQPGRSMYMLVSGQAQVVKQVQGRGEQELAKVGPGAVLGEMSLLLDQPRSATVRLLEDSQVIRMTPLAFKKLAADHAEFLEHLSQLVEARSHENEELLAMFKEQKAETKEGRIKAVLSHIRAALKL